MHEKQLPELRALFEDVRKRLAVSRDETRLVIIQSRKVLERSRRVVADSLANLQAGSRKPTI